MRKPHRKQLLAWLLTAALLLTNLPVSVLSEEIIENSIQTEIVEQNESGTVEEPNLSDFPTEETGEPIEPPVSQKTNETPESGEQSETVEIPLTRILPISPIRMNRKRPNRPIRISREPLLPKSRKKRLTQIRRTSRLLKKFLSKKRPSPKKARFLMTRKRFLYPKRFGNTAMRMPLLTQNPSFTKIPP